MDECSEVRVREVVQGCREVALFTFVGVGAKGLSSGTTEEEGGAGEGESEGGEAVGHGGSPDPSIHRPNRGEREEKVDLSYFT
jgi:hypothetical protein